MKELSMNIAQTSALITGGASGLGAATARRLAGLGAQVVIADLNREHVVDLERELGDRARFVEADVTDEASVPQVCVSAASQGGLHILVCCAGVATAEKVLGKEGPLELKRFGR